MGLFGRKKPERVRGTARVVSTSRPPHAATHGRLDMDLVVEAPGIPAYAHSYREMVMAVSKWPSGYGVLPVTIDPTDHDDVEVLWDEVRTNSESARDTAEQMAAMMRGEPTASAGPPGAPADAIAAIQQMFPGATISVGGAPPSTPPGGPSLPPPPTAQPIVLAGGQVNVVASQSGGDPVARLEKLANLRAAGVIDDAQFEQLRAQILGQAGLG